MTFVLGSIIPFLIDNLHLNALLTLVGQNQINLKEMTSCSKLLPNFYVKIDLFKLASISLAKNIS